MIDPRSIFQFGSVEATETGGFRCQWQVPSDLPYFVGHFPGQPVMPAVAILDGSQEFLRAGGLKVSPVKITLKKAKFLALVAPGMNLELSAEPLNGQWQVRWLNRDAPSGPRLPSVCEISFLL